GCGSVARVHAHESAHRGLRPPTFRAVGAVGLSRHRRRRRRRRARPYLFRNDPARSGCPAGRVTRTVSHRAGGYALIVAAGASVTTVVLPVSPTATVTTASLL